MSKNSVLERNEHNILFEVSYELLEETFEPIVNYINSPEFKERLKNRMKENGVILEFKDDSSVDELGLPKYLVESDVTLDNINDDIGVLRFDK